MGVCVCVVCACAWVRVWVCVVGDERGRVLLGDNVCFLVRLACLLTELFELKITYTHSPCHSSHVQWSHVCSLWLCKKGIHRDQYRHSSIFAVFTVTLYWGVNEYVATAD